MLTASMQVVDGKQIAVAMCLLYTQTSHGHIKATFLCKSFDSNYTDEMCLIDTVWYLALFM